VSECVTVPVVASGGAGSARDVVEAMAAGADAALVAGIVHDRVTTVASIKQAMREAAVPVRDAAAAAA